MVALGPQNILVDMPPQFYQMFIDWSSRKGIGTMPAYDLPWRLPPRSPAVHVLRRVPIRRHVGVVGWNGALALEFRQRLGIESRRAFAAQIGVGRNAVNKWELAAERGEEPELSDKTRAGLTALLSISPPEVQDHFARYGVNQDAPSRG